MLLQLCLIYGKTYPFQTLTVDDGLPQSHISVIHQDSRGFLWLGTYGGLVRFDGTKLKPYTLNDGYPFFMIKGIVEPEPEVLWIADNSRGLWELTGDTVKQIIIDKDIEDFNINFIYKGWDNRILLGVEPGGLYIYDNGSFERIGQEKGLVSEQVISAAIDRDQNIWIGTFEDGAQYIVDGVPGITINDHNGLPGNYVRYILPRTNGEVWFGTKTGLYIFKSSEYVTLLNEPGQERFIFHILEENDSTIWVSSANNGGGLIRIENKQVAEIIDMNSGLPSHKATYLYIDQYGTFFTGTANGLATIVNRNFVNYSRSDGLIDPYITAVCQSPEETIYVGTQDAGVYRLHENSFVPIRHPELNKFRRIKYLLTIDHQLWCATSRGLVILENNIPVHNRLTSFFYDKSIRKITQAENGKIYVTCYRYIYEVDEDLITDISYNLSDRKFSLWAFDTDKKGRLWLVTNGYGVWYLEGETWVRYPAPYKEFPDNFYGISKDQQNNLYFASSNGAHKWNGDDFSLIFSPNETVWDILPSSTEGIWFGTSKGLYQKKNMQLNLYNMSTGLTTSEFNISSFFEDIKGNLWFGGVGGLVQYRNLKQPASQVSPLTYIQSVESNIHTFQPGDTIIFKPDENSITIRFIGILFENSKSIRYRYRLENFDSNWNPEFEQTFVTYTNLPGGDYTFRLQAKGQSGIWNDIPAAISFTILKPLWTRWWSWPIYIALFSLTVWGIIQWRLRILQKQTLILEAKVRDRTASLEHANYQLNQEIIQRKKAEEQLKENEQKLLAIFESSNDGILVVGSNGQVLHTNQRFAEMWGIPKEIIQIGEDEKLPDYVLEQLDNPQEFLHKVEALYKTSKSSQDLVIFRDGRIFSRRSYPLLMQGKVMGRVWAFQDITERKRAEDNLKQSEINFRNIFNLSSDAIFIKDKNLKIIDTNKGAEKLFGYSRQELLSRPEKTLGDRSKNDYKLAEKYTQEALKGIPQRIEWWGLKKDGTSFLEEILINKTIYDSNEVLLFTLRDITTRKQAEQETKDLANIIETSLNEIYIFNAETLTFLEVNHGARENIGYTLEELRELTPLDLKPEFTPETFNKLIEPLKSGKKEIIQFDTVHKRKNGSLYPVLVNLQLSHFKGDTAFVAIILDITERQQAEQERHKLETQMLHAQKLESLGILAGGIAHDFNNILMGILGNADLALTKLKSYSPAKGFIDGIYKSARRAANLVNQMLAYSGKGKFTIEAININNFIEEMVHLLKISISKKAVLKFNYTENLHAFSGDPSQIRQILMNLIINASEAIEDRSGVIAISTGEMYCDRDYLDTTILSTQQLSDVSLVPEGMYVFFEVADTGCGMSQKTTGRIFDPFFTTKFAGRGLGLAAVLGIVRGHKGVIKIYSEEKKGTTFKLLFPITEETNRLESSEQISQVTENDWHGTGTFLIADDEEDIRTISKYMLEMHGFNVLTTNDGREAVKVFKKHADEIVGVLLDLTMPHLDGTQVFQEIRKIKPMVRVILTSGYNEQDATQQFIGKGLAGFIQKPFNSSNLIEKVKEVFTKT